MSLFLFHLVLFKCIGHSEQTAEETPRYEPMPEGEKRDSFYAYLCFKTHTENLYFWGGLVVNGLGAEGRSARKLIHSSG